jgi:protocatechuate 3,4-dioxygenase beta subunit
MKKLFYATAFIIATAALGQPNARVGGGCETCELMYIGQPKQINATDTSAGWNSAGQKLLITGRVLQRDGRTPARNVLLYYWHTDAKGLYTYRAGLPDGARRHGYLRGWVKTNADGRYAIYTIRPAPYPGENIPAHIHVVVKEPNLNEYYIDDWVFDDDTLLTSAERKKMTNRGSSGVLRILLNKNVQVAEDDIVLGLNIPNHPQARLSSPVQSGLEIGEDQPSFIPFHVWGPDKGSRACPVCKYGRYHGLIFFAGEKMTRDALRTWLIFFERESEQRGQYLKVYVVGQVAQAGMLTELGRELKLKNVALTYVPRFDDVGSEANLNKINTAADNTIILYRHRKIVEKFVNAEAEEVSYQRIARALDTLKGEYFKLSEPAHH